VLPTVILQLPIDEWTLLVAIAEAGAKEDERQRADMKRKSEQARRRR
jgi:hypothetical protein